MKKLRIRAYLQTPVISDKNLPLDGILYYHHVREHMGEELVTKPGESTVRESAVPLLPFKKGGPRNDSWFYHCSFAQWPEKMAEASSFKVKQGDWLRHMDFVQNKVKKMNISSGRFKAYHIKMYYRFAEYVEWYCVGDAEKISRLLQFCTAIGKNTGDGWGQVLQWEIKNWPEDWSIRGHNNKLMRAVPCKTGIPYGLRPSYWNPKHVTKCIVP